MSRRFRLRGSVGFVVLVLLAVSAPAQAPLAPGAVVRWFDVASQFELQGSIRSVSADSITVTIGPGDRSISIVPASIRSLEIRDGRRDGLHGAALGLLVGAGAGAVLGYAAGEDCSARHASFVCFSHLQGAGIVAIPFGLLGALVGGIANHPWKWRLVNGEPAHQVAVEPVVTWHYGVAVGVDVRF